MKHHFLAITGFIGGIWSFFISNVADFQAAVVILSIISLLLSIYLYSRDILRPDLRAARRRRRRINRIKNRRK